MDRERLRAMLHTEEGVRGRPYRDTEGHWTIGVGHNLDAAPLCDAAIDAQLEYDIDQTWNALVAALPWVQDLDPARQTVLADMAFNMGVPVLLDFTHTLAAFKARDWATAAAGMCASLWAKQVGPRAERLAKIVLSGEFP